MEQNGDVVAVAIDKDKSSQYALKWAVDHLLKRGQTVTLIHVQQRQTSVPTPTGNAVSISDVTEDIARTLKQQGDSQAREIFLPFRCFCTRKDVKCNEVVLEDTDISNALIDYARLNGVEVMVVGASSRNSLVRRFKGPDVATCLTKGAPDFCTVYVISKGKMLSIRSATRAAPRLPTRMLSENKMFANLVNDGIGGSSRVESPCSVNKFDEGVDRIRSPFTRGKAANGRAYGEVSMPESDISFVSSSRSSFERPSVDRMSIDRGSYDVMEFRNGPRLSNGSDIDQMSFASSCSDRRSIDLHSTSEFSCSGGLSGFLAPSPSMQEDMEAEMRRLRLELKQTMEMYNTACREALTAKQKANDLQKSKMEENQKLEEARLAEEAAMAIAEKEKAKCKAAIEAAEAAQRIAELEAQKRMNAETSHKDGEERKMKIDSWNQSDARYRKYTIEEIEIATDYFSEALKIGEGGYGPVYKCTLDHTPVAIKVLRPDAAQGQSQFQQEVDILSCIRHPNMVLLLGACPEYGCLVYEYMSNGSLEDRLFCRGKTPPLPWQLRFRIAAEIGTGLLFLHQTKPEPLVHRDLKPANILIDRNYVSKISDVGLARLVPPSVADNVTQYRMTQTAGTFCYIDPEYQQTGMLGTKSDIYSLGILYLQLITAKPAMGLTHHVQRAIEKDNLIEILDPAVPDWPLEETMHFAKLSLKCAELRRKDRPDLTKLLPELNRLREFAEENMSPFMFAAMPTNISRISQPSTSQEVISANQSLQSEASSRASSARSLSSMSPTH